MLCPYSYQYAFITSCASKNAYTRLNKFDYIKQVLSFYTMMEISSAKAHDVFPFSEGKIFFLAYTSILIE